MDGVVTANTEESRTMARRLALEEGVFCGVSSGAAVAAAVKVHHKVLQRQTHSLK